MMKKIMKKEQGFTLIELIIVIAILAIIAAIAIPNILGAVDNSRKSTDVANAKIIANAAAQVMAKNADASGAAFTGANVLKVTGMTAIASPSTANDRFHNSLLAELNSAAPTPKYKGVANTGAFYLDLTATGEVKVYIGSDAAAATEAEKKAYEVVPTPITPTPYN